MYMIGFLKVAAACTAFFSNDYRTNITSNIVSPAGLGVYSAEYPILDIGAMSSKQINTFENSPWQDVLKDFEPAIATFEADDWADALASFDDTTNAFLDDKPRILKHLRPGKGKYGVSRQQIENDFFDAGLEEYAVLDNPILSRKVIAKEQAKNNWTLLKQGITKEGPEILANAITMKAAYHNAKDLTNMIAPTSLEELPVTFSNVGQAVGSCASAYKLGCQTPKAISQILIPTYELGYSISIIVSEELNDVYKKYMPGLKRKSENLTKIIGNKVSYVKNRLPFLG